MKDAMLDSSPGLVPTSSHVGPVATTLSAITEGRGEDLGVHGGLDPPWASQYSTKDGWDASVAAHLL